MVVPKLGLDIPKRYLSCSLRTMMPYKPQDMIPLTPQQKKIYPMIEQKFSDEGFPLLKLFPSKGSIFDKRQRRKMRRYFENLTNRETTMSPKIDWPSAWPTAKTFTPSAIPLPLRQSFETRNLARGKYCNTELLKISNFLHLTPKAVERQCKAILKFCSAWPEGLDSDEEVREHFPVTRITQDYVHSSPTIRDARARVVEVKLFIDDLKLNPEDEDKLIRLAEDRYDDATRVLTIKADACPFRKQNEDYADYLLTALYFESRKHEKWESEKSEHDCKEPDLDIGKLEEYRSKVEKQLGFES